MRPTQFFIIYSSGLFLLNQIMPSSSAPFPRPHPEPLPPSLAQGVIAALTFVHAGVIGYAINHEVQIETEALIGESKRILAFLQIIKSLIFQQMVSKVTMR